MNLTIREKLLIFFSFFCIIFYVYYNFAFNPLMASINNNYEKIIQIKNLIKQQKSADDHFVPLRIAAQNLLPQEGQLTHILNYVNAQIKDYHIKLLSLTQSSIDRKIFIDLSLQGKYEGILNFLNSLENSNSFLYIDSADISTQGKISE